eukprot:8307426-Karenia_brevis.AAC.1
MAASAHTAKAAAAAPALEPKAAGVALGAAVIQAKAGAAPPAAPGPARPVEAAEGQAVIAEEDVEVVMPRWPAIKDVVPNVLSHQAQVAVVLGHICGYWEEYA